MTDAAVNDAADAAMLLMAGGQSSSMLSAGTSAAVGAEAERKGGDDCVRELAIAVNCCFRHAQQLDEAQGHACACTCEEGHSLAGPGIGSDD